MATKKPRITITLEPYPYEVLRSMSDSSGQTMSGIISSIIDMSLPVLERMAATYQQVKRSGDMERGRLMEALQEAQDTFEPLVMARVAQKDLSLGQGVTAAAPAALATPQAAVAPIPSPVLTGGHTSTRKSPESQYWQGFHACSKKEVLKKVGGKKS